MSRIEETTCKEIREGKHWDNPEKLSFIFSLESDQEPLGKVDCFNFNNRNHSCEIGYVLNPAYRGKGYGAKMVAMILTYLFKDRSLNKVHCQTASFNEPSIKLLEKLQFHREGILREHHELDSKLYDDYIYSILNHEFDSETIHQTAAPYF